jgi:cell division control protein 6
MPSGEPCEMYYIGWEKYIKPPESILGDVRDPAVFDLNYTPKRIYERPELAEIMHLINLYLGGVRVPCVIWGERGSGKTTTARAIERGLPEFLRGKGIADSLEVVYVNCQERPTSYQIYQYLTGKKGGTAKSVMKEELKKKKRMILILDEADLLKDDDILYFIPRETSIYLMLLTRNKRWFDELDAAVKSSLSPEHIMFNPYTTEQMKEILTMRAEEGLKYFKPEVIAALSAIVVSDYDSDTRVGVRSLFWIGLRRAWDEKYVRGIVEESMREVEEFTLRTIGEEDLRILYYAVKERETNKAYEALLREHQDFEWMSKASFFRRLNRLKNMGLIDLMDVYHGRVHTLEVKPLIRNIKILEDEYKKRGRI